MKIPTHSQVECFHDLRDEMRGCDEVDVVCALLLQLEHAFGELSDAHLLTVAKLAYGIILTEGTVQGAAAHEYGSRAALSGYGGFLPVMKRPGGHLRCISHPASPGARGETVDTAVKGTNRAGLQFFFQ